MTGEALIINKPHSGLHQVVSPELWSCKIPSTTQPGTSKGWAKCSQIRDTPTPNPQGLREGRASPCAAGQGGEAKAGRGGAPHHSCTPQQVRHSRDRTQRDGPQLPPPQQGQPSESSGTALPSPALSPGARVALPGWHPQGSSSCSGSPPTSLAVQEANGGGEEQGWGAVADPSWAGGYRMTQGGRLLVIFSRGSPFLALRMASIRSFS